MMSVGELTRWTVVLIAGGEGSEVEICPGIRVDMLKRKENAPHEDRYSIGRLMSSRDESIDLDEQGVAGSA